ncbi:MAG TPA: N-methyl-L-tryptophan oxidase [Caulobacteraceae bacterium]
MTTYDLIVVGLGAMGAATALQAARRGARVLAIDSHHPPHDQGSSHGETRITRRAIGEGLDYVPLALRAHEIWRALEAETGETLMRTPGALLISTPGMGVAHHGKPDFLETTIEAARAFGVEHENLSPAEVRARWPQFRMRDEERAYFEPGAGILYPERCIAAQLRLAGASGAEIRTGETIRQIASWNGHVTVTTDQGTYEADRAVVCAGGWTGQLLGGVWARRLRLYRQCLHWFEPADPAAFAPERFPVFIWMYGERDGDWFYGFPVDPDFGGVKISGEQFGVETRDPDAWDRGSTRGEALACHARHLAGHLDGVPPAWLRSVACAYTLAPDSRFIVDEDPERTGVIVVSACSGHGFKHSPAIGEAAAAWALTGERPAVLAPFGLAESL